MNRDRWRHSYFIVRGEVLGFVEDELLRKHLTSVLIDQERYRHSLNDADWGLEVVSFMTPSALYEKSKLWGSGRV